MFAVHLYKCSNCGQELSEDNIKSALEDYGETDTVSQDHITLCCPSYTDKKGCQGYTREDREKPAYWIYR